MEARPSLKGVEHWTDLDGHGKKFNGETGEDLYTWLVYVDAEDVPYFGQTEVVLRDVTLQDIRDCLKRIPDEEVYPELDKDTRVFTGPVTDKFYVKRPNFGDSELHAGTNDLANLLKGDIDALELLSKHPHPHIVRYHGCLVQRGRITGMVLDMFPITLKNAVEGNEDEKINLDAQQRNTILLDVMSAVTHLHSLGLAHNDLKPSNIMLDAENRAHLIDFGSCKPLGQRLMEGGTKGWIEVHSGFSDVHHDEVGLKKIKAWLEL